MNIVILGKGGREQAIYKALVHSPLVQKIFIAPGWSFETKKEQLWPAYPWDKTQAKHLIKNHNIDLAIIGPEKELSEGASDFFRSLKVPVFGPSQKAARLESSKIFAKHFMSSANIPTSNFQEVDSVSATLKASQHFGFPVVLKADGLAGGKGVFICHNKETLKEKAENLFEKNLLGSAGKKALVEQFQTGWEMSVFALITNPRVGGDKGCGTVLPKGHNRRTDPQTVTHFAGPRVGGDKGCGTVLPKGHNRRTDPQTVTHFAGPRVGGDKTPYQILPFAKDYKKLKENNQGPNTGGMGAFAPHFISPELKQTIETKIVDRSVQAIQKNNFFYRGVLYIGLMIVNNKHPIVLEYNVRFGDPETQVLMPLLDGDWAQVFLSVAKGTMPPLKWKNNFFASCVVLASKGYPEKSPALPIKGDITNKSTDSYFLPAGAKQTKEGWFTNGGRVLNAIGLGASKKEAIQKAYEQAGQVHWQGMQKRTDIGT